MAKNIGLTFDADGIGPHYNGNKINNSQHATGALKIAIYAENGTGKTFFSRMFALSEKPLKTVEDTERLLSLGENRGFFKFTIKNSGTPIHEYNVQLQKGNLPNISVSGKNYKYHVFNSDYVEENIAQQEYSPDGSEITGYVLGKENIDVSDEKKKKESIEEELENLGNLIEKKISDSKSELKSKKINSVLNEFKRIDKALVLSEQKTSEQESYVTLCSQLTTLKSIPDNIPTLTVNTYPVYIECLRDTVTYLKTSYSRTHFDELAMKMIEKVRTDPNFYYAGLLKYESSEEERCPFCHQKLHEYGMYVLDLYKEYFNQQESQVISEIETNINAVLKIGKDIKERHTSYNKMVALFSKYKNYIPEYKDIIPKVLPNDNVAMKSIENIVLTLQKKKSDIERNSFDISEYINEVLLHIETIEVIFNEQYQISLNLQSVLENSDSVRKGLHRKLCNSKLNSIIDDCTNEIKRIKELQEEWLKLDNSIKKKEGKSKKAKKEMVIEDLKAYLNYFFHEKYQFDEKTFGISFNNYSLNKKAKHVLSDGEKSIVAFCYYLATAHMLVEQEDDYEDLFFVFDDPISSMDFKYVYAIADVIRGLQNSFAQSGHEMKLKFLVFTHNAEFMSILMRNKVVNLKLNLKPGIIEPMQEELLLPYEHHLQDLLNVISNKKPTHTTPNSIRHVIETIMHFASPKENSSEKYVRKNDILNQNAYLYGLMQDGSHGAVRIEKPVTDSEVVEAASVTIEFVKSMFPHQFDKPESMDEN